MSNHFLLVCLTAFCLQACHSQETTAPTHTSKEDTVEQVEAAPNIEAISISDSSEYALFLKNLPLKPAGSQVLLYNGQPKPNQDVHVAVIDMELSKRDLQQCADAVMRLRGEFLFAQKRFNDIHFNFLSDGKPRYFLKHSNGDTSYKAFRKYMDWIFTYANTRSLHNELKKVALADIQAGDVFIVTGRPYGHAVTVMEVGTQGNRTVFKLAQSYMPAQETHILKNPLHPENGGWYFLDEIDSDLYTPEWTFPADALRRFN
ncbi:MAG: DUF4846 domain-containing protein [Bacteroidia bacterium]